MIDDEACFCVRPADAQEAQALYQRYREAREHSAAVTAQAACPDMCSLLERLERQAHGLVDGRFEAAAAVPDSKPRGRPFTAIDHRRAVACYRRDSGQAGEARDGRDVRPPRVLLATSDHLLSAVLSDSGQPLLARFLYVRDRYRAVAQQLTVQGLHVDADGELAAAGTLLYERMARFYLLCGYLLLDCDAADVEPALNREQLRNCLTSLRQLYERHGPSPSAGEFLCYDVLGSLVDGAPPAMCLLGLAPAALHCPPVQLALRLLASLCALDYRAFFRCYRRDAPPLLRCLLHRHLPVVRLAALSAMRASYRGAMPVAFITDQLCMADDDETACFLAANGVAPPADAVVTFAAQPPSGAGMAVPARRLPQYIDELLPSQPCFQSFVEQSSFLH